MWGTVKILSNPRKVFFPVTIKDHGRAKHRLVELTENSPDFEFVKDDPGHASYQIALNIAQARNRMRGYTFAQSDAILASVLLAREEAGLVERGFGWFCPHRHYNAAFRQKCSDCGVPKP